jgi:hypothetical protein
MASAGLSGRLGFRITSDTISITQNGVVLAQASHSLSESARSQLRNATVNVGSGDYGPFSGTLAAVQ